ncbi:MAG: thrombospondin type 3 repeat-containing protein, partial [Pseudomonadota bacterium]
PDNDFIDASEDNCTEAANTPQRDTDGDGFGNLCDGDFNNDGFTNFADLSLFRATFGTTDPDGDLNGDGIVNFSDLGIFRGLFGKAPGPSGTN